MLSKDAVKLLKWLNQHDQWMTSNEIKKNCKVFDNPAFKALTSAKLVKSQMSMDSDSWVEYRISDSGKAYLEGLRARRLPELREWINIFLALIPFLSGVIFSNPVKTFFRWIMELLT